MLWNVREYENHEICVEFFWIGWSGLTLRRKLSGLMYGSPGWAKSTLKQSQKQEPRIPFLIHKQNPGQDRHVLVSIQHGPHSSSPAIEINSLVSFTWWPLIWPLNQHSQSKSTTMQKILKYWKFESIFYPEFAVKWK